MSAASLTIEQVFGGARANGLHRHHQAETQEVIDGFFERSPRAAHFFL
jgi:hypothetical protein